MRLRRRATNETMAKTDPPNETTIPATANTHRSQAADETTAKIESSNETTRLRTCKSDTQMTLNAQVLLKLTTQIKPRYQAANETKAKTDPPNETTSPK